jgi:hypothetical protein
LETNIDPTDAALDHVVIPENSTSSILLLVCLGNNRATPDADPTDARFSIAVPHERNGRDIGIRAESPTHGDHIADQGGLVQCHVKEREANARVRHQLEGDLAWRSLPPALRSTVLMLVFGGSKNHADPVILLESLFQLVGKQRGAELAVITQLANAGFATQ